MQTKVIGRESRFTTLFAIDENDDILNLEADVLQRFDSFHDRGARRDQVFNAQAGLSRLKSALNLLLRTVRLHLLTTHQHRHVMRERHARRDRQSRVRHAANVVKLCAVRRQHVPHALRHRRQNVRVGHNHAQIDINRGQNPRLERKLPKLHRLDLVQAQDERCFVSISKTHNVSRPIPLPHPRVVVTSHRCAVETPSRAYHQFFHPCSPSSSSSSSSSRRRVFVKTARSQRVTTRSIAASGPSPDVTIRDSTSDHLHTVCTYKKRLSERGRRRTSAGERVSRDRTTTRATRQSHARVPHTERTHALERICLPRRNPPSPFARRRAARYVDENRDRANG